MSKRKHALVPTARKDLGRYRRHYSEARFWEKVKKISGSAGRQVLEKALILYVLLTEGDVPWWVKASIVATLGYFICPIDLAPDFLPGGYLDDLAAMAVLLGEVYVFVTPAVRKRVEELLSKR